MNWSFCLVLYENAPVYVSKSKQAKNAEKQPKSQKSTFFAFFRTEGKVEDFRAILRRAESYLRCFISGDKGRKLASRAKTVLVKINVK